MVSEINIQRAWQHLTRNTGFLLKWNTCLNTPMHGFKGCDVASSIILCLSNGAWAAVTFPTPFWLFTPSSGAINVDCLASLHCGHNAATSLCTCIVCVVFVVVVAQCGTCILHHVGDTLAVLSLTSSDIKRRATSFYRQVVEISRALHNTVLRPMPYAISHNHVGFVT